MKLKIYRHMWGQTRPFEHHFPEYKAKGYDGIEAGLQTPEKRGKLLDLLKEHGFEFSPGVYTAGDSVQEHLASYRSQLETAAKMTHTVVRSHSGRDAWNEKEADAFFTEALKIEKELGLTVAHETHRGRVMYNPWTTLRLVEKFPDLKILADFSHWVCVCERLLEDQEPIIRAVAPRCVHIHARVGHSQGPQVNDPRAPENKAALEAHEAWWKIIWEAQAKAGRKTLALTPEFGPPTYMPILPHTRQPVADLDEVCDWMATREREMAKEWSKN